ncbi:BatD family protein [Sediminicola luteus]|uniref:BatD protein n=1 Tax=Sediminicola luteus TaxID=319238 RepID=A0A2A4G1Q3_9FLAO|nr:BatD family protein [Sediminicola luteus]PCE62909.1 BatD protein [Sediminicola luteus]
MKKTGKHNIGLKPFLLGLVFLFVGWASWAQDAKTVNFELKLSKETLGINERLQVEFAMNHDGDNFQPPSFEGFRVVMGPSQSIQRSYINGKRHYSKTYSYVLAPQAQGTQTIGQASITIKGQVYKSVPKTVKVTAAVDKPSDQVTADDFARDNLHLVAEVSDARPYLNQAISVVYKLYFSQYVNVSHFNPLDNPTYNNFWSQDIPVKQYKAANGTYDGKAYRYVILKRVVLYPQKTGKLELEPLSLDVTVDVPTNKRDFFGSRIYTQANKTVSAGRRTINVKALPEAGKPAGFTGAVGDFDFLVTTSKTHLNASESLQAKVTVSGKGNLKLFELPSPSFPASLEVYEPEFDEKIRTTISGMDGKVSNSYTIVPSYRGKYPIPPINFSYFNPKTQKYHTIDSQELLVNVVEGPLASGANTTAATVASGTNKQIVNSGKNFNFLKTATQLQPLGTTYFFGSKSYWLWLLLPLLLIPLAIIFRKKREAIAQDVVGNKVKKANKLAKRFLSEAKKNMGQKEQFYDALHRALHNYLKAKLKIETTEFSKDKITDLLNEKEVSENHITAFISLLQNCEMARYSPFSDVQMHQDYDKASDVISQMDKQL